MGSTGEPDFGGPQLGAPASLGEENDTGRKMIVIAVVGVVAIMLGLAFLLREKPKPPKQVSPYLASVKLSDFKMSAAENFIGTTVSYIDGSITNSADKAMTHVVVEVTFKDDTGQVAQRDEVALQVVRNNGAYTEPVDLTVAPLAPGQSAPFRLTFERISAQWNHEYPEIRVTDVAVK
jgi:hypothetical protein